MHLLNHDIAHEFPEYLERMRTLKTSSQRFANLFAEYDEDNHAIARYENGQGVIRDEALEALSEAICAVIALLCPRRVVFGGGVPVSVKDAVVGAVGVAGGMVPDDEAVAAAVADALAAACSPARLMVETSRSGCPSVGWM